MRTANILILASAPGKLLGPIQLVPSRQPSALLLVGWTEQVRLQLQPYHIAYNFVVS
jgi:hypothetical protein